MPLLVGFRQKLLTMAKMLVRMVLNLLKKNVRTKKFWILSAVAARAAYVAVN